MQKLINLWWILRGSDTEPVVGPGQRSRKVKTAKAILVVSFIFIGSLLCVSGCIYNDEPGPQITPNRNRRIFGTEQGRSMLASVVKSAEEASIPFEWLPPLQVEKKWTAVVIHHSGTKNGNTAIFDKWHREGNHWEGVGYNFVIGNGTDSADGRVEVTFRWRRQITGAHCRGTRGNWANENAIGICLVGNFNRTSPTYRQWQSLVKLIRFLQKRYNIPKSRIYGHNTTPGALATDCPGRKFSVSKLEAMVDY